MFHSITIELASPHFTDAITVDTHPETALAALFAQCIKQPLENQVKNYQLLSHENGNTVIQYTAVIESEKFSV